MAKHRIFIASSVKRVRVIIRTFCIIDKCLEALHTHNHSVLLLYGALNANATNTIAVVLSWLRKALIRTRIRRTNFFISLFLLPLKKAHFHSSLLNVNFELEKRMFLFIFFFISVIYRVLFIRSLAYSLSHTTDSHVTVSCVGEEQNKNKLSTLDTWV